MTVKELDNAFKLYLNKVDSMATADFLPLERQQLLNDAQLWLARKVCQKKSQDQDEVDLRRSLSTSYPEQVPTVLNWEASVALPEDYLTYALARVLVTVKDKQYAQRPILVGEDELLNMLNDPFNKPTLQEPVLCFTGGVLAVYPEGVSAVRLTYYRKPAKLVLATPNQVCELSDVLCLVLVQRAVQLALESTTDPRVQTQNAILQTTTP